MSFSKKISLDNLRIKDKLTIIYIFCVIIPILFTNSFMYFLMKTSATKEQIDLLNNTLQRLEYNLAQKVVDCISVSNYLYSDRILNNFLNKYYLSGMDYYNEYNALIRDNVIGYYYRAESVYDIKIYTSNPTLINGGHFFKKDIIQDEEWYKAFVKSGKDIFLYAYYDQDGRYTPKEVLGRKISIIRRLDNFNKKGYGKIIKIDMDYEEFLRAVKNEGENKDIYICDSNNILLSTNSTYQSTSPFRPKSEMELKDVCITDRVSFVSEQWDIYMTTDKISWLPQTQENEMRWILLILCNLVLPTMVILVINKSFSQRIRLTEVYLKKVEKEEFERIECHEGKDEIGNLIRSYNMMVIKIKELIEVVFKKTAEQQALMLSKTQAELNALQSQVNPHFLFNTLESIRMRSLLKKEVETANIIGELAHLMRRTIKWGEDFVTIDEEMQFVLAYLKIQQYRFGERLTFEMEIDERCKKVRIAKFGIITFVENACVHGIEGKMQGGCISVRIFQNETGIHIYIEDNGIGMNREKLKSIREQMNNGSIEMLNGANSIGVLNTYIRLKMYYKGKAVCNIQSIEGEGTKIHMILPLDEIEFS